MDVRAAPPGVPITFDAAASWCFGWYHAAQGAARGLGVVLCRPIGYEAMCTYQTYAQLADTLAQAGFDVLRFDYEGTGDSAGTDADPKRVNAWVESIVRACGELRRLSGVQKLALFGVRLGATLAVRAASNLGGVDALVMWGPCPSGRAFARELRAASANRADGGVPVDRSGDMEALGFLYTAETVRDMQALDARHRHAARAARARDRAGRPARRRAAAAGLSRAGHASAVRVVARLLGHDARAAQGDRGAGHARCDRAVARAGRPPHRMRQSQARSASAPFPPRALPEGMREEPVAFGSDASLFGVMTHPPPAAANAGRAQTAIVFLSVGHNYRIGPNRLYVRMARALAGIGFTVLRFDLSGIGDSRARPGARKGEYYARDSVGDVTAALDCLQARGCTRFWLMGVCSGSYAAFQTALADPRVTGQVLMNSRLLEWQEGAGDDTWQASMQLHYKSTAFYRRALMRPQVYRRLLRGEVDVNGIARRVGTVIEARVKRAVGSLLHRGAREESVLTKARRLCARGTDTLVVMAAEDDGRDYVEFHFGDGGARLAGDPHFRMVVIEGCDHTFSSGAGQRLLIATVRQHLEQRLGV